MIGYIEGFYGRLLNWENRKRIINSLHEHSMKFYFYAPKEDVFHRVNWRIKYPLLWRKKFKCFTNYSKKKNIKIIAGIAPGIDFDFNCLLVQQQNTNKNDFNLLLKKSQQLLKDGADHIALLLDDIPKNFSVISDKNASEGYFHGLLVNKLSKALNKQVYFVPRIYADELIEDAPNYLIDLSKIINPNVKIFYCGNNVVCNKINKNDFKYVKKLMANKIYIWDNFYANDYCPRRLFLGPWKGRKNINNILINPTGMIETDLLIISVIASCLIDPSNNKTYRKVLIKNKIPIQFNLIANFFNKPSTNENIKEKIININIKKIKAIDYLLWEWKSNISIEWYPYLLSLKHDLLLSLKVLTPDRIIKTQTNPLSKLLLKYHKYS